MSVKLTKEEQAIQDVYMKIDDCMRYCNEQCQKYECPQCPGEKHAKKTGNVNCELYFAKEYFDKSKIKLLKEDKNE